MQSARMLKREIRTDNSKTSERGICEQCGRVASVTDDLSVVVRSEGLGHKVCATEAIRTRLMADEIIVLTQRESK